MDSTLVPHVIVLAIGGLLAVLGILAMFSLISMGTSLKRIASEQKKQDERLAQILDTLLSSLFQSAE
jgi:hypothetical protein